MHNYPEPKTPVYDVFPYGILGQVCLTLLFIPNPVASDNGQFEQEIKVLGTWKTFRLLTNMRCRCSYVTNTIISSFRVNISLSRPATFYGAWIAKLVQSSTTNTWHLLENKYDSHPPEIELWFDLRYDKHEPQPTGVCIWSMETDTDRTIAKPTPSPDAFYLKNTTQLKTLTPEPDNSTTHTDGTDDHSNETTGDDNQEVPAIASCLCPCSCAKKSEEEINAMIQDIVTDLKIEKNTTALGRRRLSSVADTRWVSRGLGYVGILVMTVVFGSIALADYRKFLNSYRLFMKNFRKRKPAVNYSSDADQIRQNSVSE